MKDTKPIVIHLPKYAFSSRNNYISAITSTINQECRDFVREYEEMFLRYSDKYMINIAVFPTKNDYSSFLEFTNKQKILYYNTMIYKDRKLKMYAKSTTLRTGVKTYVIPITLATFMSNIHEIRKEIDEHIENDKENSFVKKYNLYSRIIFVSCFPQKWTITISIRTLKNKIICTDETYNEILDKTYEMVFPLEKRTWFSLRYSLFDIDKGFYIAKMLSIDEENITLQLYPNLKEYIFPYEFIHVYTNTSNLSFLKWISPYLSKDDEDFESMEETCRLCMSLNENFPQDRMFYYYKIFSLHEYS